MEVTDRRLSEWASALFSPEIFDNNLSNTHTNMSDKFLLADGGDIVDSGVGSTISPQSEGTKNWASVATFATAPPPPHLKNY